MEAGYLTKGKLDIKNFDLSKLLTLIIALNSNKFDKPFEFKHMGSMAYLGNKAGVADLGGTHMTGRKTALLWSFAYWAMSANSKTMMYIPYYW
jgi:NADH dehydrogenase FAD-containing subunit